MFGVFVLRGKHQYSVPGEYWLCQYVNSDATSHWWDYFMSFLLICIFKFFCDIQWLLVSFYTKSSIREIPSSKHPFENQVFLLLGYFNLLPIYYNISTYYLSMPKQLIVNSMIKHFHLKNLLLVFIWRGKCQVLFDFKKNWLNICYNFEEKLRQSSMQSFISLKTTTLSKLTCYIIII